MYSYTLYIYICIYISSLYIHRIHRHGILNASPVKNPAVAVAEALNVAPDELMEALKDPEKAGSHLGPTRKH